MTEVFDAPPEMIDAALRGPHAGWNSISIELEGARFHEIHSLVSSVAFDATAETRCLHLLDELEALARSAGHADADRISALAADRSEDEIEMDPELSGLRHLLMNPEQSDYFALVAGSEALISGSAATPDAGNMLRGDDSTLNGAIYSRMLAAYEDGRRAAMPEQPSLSR